MTARTYAPAITLAELSAAKGYETAQILASFGLHDLPGGRGVAIPYYDITGCLIAKKRRTHLSAKDGSFWPAGQKLAVYGEDRLDRARQQRRLLLVEGESDCWALWHADLPALGLPGAGTTHLLAPEHLTGIEAVWLVREPDHGGATFVAGLRQRLGELRFGGDVYELTMPDDVKDPAALFQRDPADFKLAMLQRMQAATACGLTAAAAQAPAAPTAEDWPPILPLRTSQAVLPFPTAVLAAPMADLVHEVASALGCAPDFVGTAVLTLAAGALGNSRALRLKEGYTEGPRLYAALVGPPSSAKSPVLKLLAQPFLRRQVQAKSCFTEDLRLFAADEAASAEEPRRDRGHSASSPFLAEMDRQRAEARRALSELPGAERTPWPRPERTRRRKPQLARCFTDDTTVEALARILQENPRGFVIVRDELTGWVLGMNQYKGGRGHDRQFYLSAWSGQPSVVDRKGQADNLPILLPQPLLCVLGGLPPDMLGALRDNLGRQDGFLERMLFAFPDPRPLGPWTGEGVGDAVLAAWDHILDYLHGLQMTTDAAGEPTPREVGLTPAGLAAWQRGYNALVAAAQQPNGPENLDCYWSKLRSYGGRLALVLQYLAYAADPCRRQPHAEVVDAPAVDGAWQLIAYFESTYRRVLGHVGADVQILRAERILKWIAGKRPTSFKRHEVWEIVKSNHRFPRIECLDAPLQRLVVHGYLRRDDWVNAVGRPSGPTFEVNPAFIPLPPENSENPEKPPN